MKKRKSIGKLSFTCAFILFFVCVFSVIPASATESIDLTLGGLVSEEIVNDSGHVSLSEKYADQLNVVEYENADGTRTIYSFPVSVKYQDASGKTSFVDNTLVKNRRDNGWNNKANYFNVFAGSAISDGIILTYGNVKLTTSFPSSFSHSLSKKVPVYSESKTLDYEGEDSKLSFSATYTGFHIEHTSSTEDAPVFAFTLSGNITSVYSENDQLFVLMNDDSVVIYTLCPSDPSAPEKIIEATVSSVLLSDGSYQITCTYTRPLATSRNTVTMLMDASIVQPTEQNDRSAQDDGPWYDVSAASHYDASVYSNGASTNYGTTYRCLVGVDGTMGTARSYVRFDLSNIDVDYHDIVSAKYRIRELTAYAAPFQAEVYMVKESWSEYGITWNNQPLCDSEKVTTMNLEWLNQESYYTFYITRAAMAWFQGLENNGIVIRSRIEGSTSCRAFASREYGYYMPHFSITYNESPGSMDNIGIVDNTQYYIKNKNSHNYLTASGTSDNSLVTQTTWTGENNQKWILVPEGEGYYKLKPVSATSKALEVNTNVNNDGVNMRLFSSGNRAGQVFKFIRNWDGSYQIVTEFSNSLRGLWAYDDSQNNIPIILHKTHTLDWLKNDDWTLEPVNKGYAEIFCFTEEVYGLNTSTYAGQMIEPLEDMGYWAYKYEDVGSQIAYALLPSEDIFIFSGHGGTSYLSFLDDPLDYRNEVLTAGNSDYPAISALPHNALAGLRAALFAGCATGADDGGVERLEIASNLVGITYQRGAHFVLGRPEPVAYPTDDIWVVKFLSFCASGYTVYEAMCAADDYIYNNLNNPGVDFGNANQHHVLGDYSLRLDR